MELELALLADAANVSREGKLNILGVFDAIYVQRFPCQFPQMQLILRFRADPVETGRAYKVEIQIIDQDGKKLTKLDGELGFPDSPEKSKGLPMRADHILGFANAVFERPGPYEFVILVNGEVRKRVSLYVAEKPPVGPAAAA